MEVVIWCQLTGEGGDIEEQENDQLHEAGTFASPCTVAECLP